MSDDRSLSETLVIRLFQGSDDIVALNALLRSAYRPLAAAGMNYAASFEDVEATRRQVSKGECYIGLLGNEMVSCVILRLTNSPSAPDWYRQEKVGTFGRFAVRPDLQRSGVGAKMMDSLEKVAMDHGLRELALDTSEGAHHLIQMYEKRGYRFVGYHQWSHTNYRSVILSKRVSP